MNTSDDCANNFDENDRLGVNLNGTNGVRSDHNSVDIQANYGDAVYAEFTGTVENVGISGGCGYRVQIRNNDGSHTTYCHLVDGISTAITTTPASTSTTSVIRRRRTSSTAEDADAARDDDLDAVCFADGDGRRPDRRRPAAE
ncbi:MAG TPA: M23 family metallopeptidase [Thermoanaerobaculia bacterium]|nr:M23 family metallopeptidase [Thermoanaerobaculia bacterium]